MEKESELLRIVCGDALEQLRLLPEESVQCCVTSPPYWGLRNYGHTGQIGLEKTLDEYVAKMVAVFRDVRRNKHGKIPKGLLVHHLDGNSMHDALWNYALVTRAQHINSHRLDLRKSN